MVSALLSALLILLSALLILLLSVAVRILLVVLVRTEGVPLAMEPKNGIYNSISKNKQYIFDESSKYKLNSFFIHFYFQNM